MITNLKLVIHSALNCTLGVKFATALGYAFFYSLLGMRFIQLLVDVLCSVNFD
jgi:hypothetical protein